MTEERSGNTGFALNLDGLNLAEYNPRKISDDALGRLKASIKSHTAAISGWAAEKGLRLVDPIIVNDANRRVVGGHQRIKALRDMGQTWVHADDVRHVFIEDERKEAALNIALNNQRMAGEFDIPKLKDLIVEIDAGDFNITEFIGFEQIELDTMFGKVVEPPEAFKTFDENIKTDYQCPKCGYEWSGQPKGKRTNDATE